MKKNRSRLGALVPLAVALASMVALGGAIPEPPTIIYGRIVHLVAGREVPVYAGVLSFTVRPAGLLAPAMTVSTRLASLAEGTLSYRAALPNEAQATGLTPAPGSLALTSEEASYEITDIGVDGKSARPLRTSGTTLAISQVSRGKAHRLDLVVDTDLTDSDGDGLPDVWEAAFGLNPDDPGDATSDLDGDGLTNRHEYLLGTDPRRDDRVPSLAANTIQVYAACRTGVLLQVIDVDTAPEGIQVGIVETPMDAMLELRREAGEAVLAAGDTFTLAEVHAGNLTLREASGQTADRRLVVSLSDGTPGHPAVTAEIAISVYRPATLPENWFAAAPATVAELLAVTGRLGAADRAEQIRWTAARWFGGSVWQVGLPHGPAHFVPPARAILWTAAADEALRGSAGNDILCAGDGAVSLTGNAGADVFVLSAHARGPVTIVDFRPHEGDILDLSALVQGAAGTIEEYVRTTILGADVRLDVSTTGMIASGTDCSLTLLGVAAGFSFDALWAAGNIVAGGLGAPTLVSVSVAEGDGQASETGPLPAAFALHRQGPRTESFDVGIQLSGTARNGVDYQFVPATASFAAGERVARVVILPIVDYEIEPLETVILTVLPGEGYAAFAPTHATVTIADLAETVAVEAVQDAALVDSLQPATVMVRREGMLARPATVWLSIGGTAAPGADYAPLPTRLTFAAWQTAQYLDVVPHAGADLRGQRRSVTITLLVDPARQYTLAPERHAVVWLYPDLAGARDSNGDGIPDIEDPDFDGLTNAEETVLGSDPNAPSLVLRAGWNLVSVPGLPVGEQTLAAQLGAAFKGVVWAWEGSRYMLLVDAPMQPGRGYMVFVPADVILDLRGLAAANGQVYLQAGWNAIGPIRGGLWDGEAAGALYGLADNEYRALDEPRLRPMHGYWYYCHTPGTVVLP